MITSLSDVTEKSVTLSSDCETEGGNKQVQVCVTVERNDCWEVFLHAQHWLINKTGLPLQMKVPYNTLMTLLTYRVVWCRPVT